MEAIANLIMPERCYKNIFHDHMLEITCMKIILSKLLGCAIILGSVMVKVPQILKILKAGSSEGISLLGVVLELVACTGTLSYSYAMGFPFSSYGEAVFMSFQQAIIMFLVLLFGSGTSLAVICTAVYSVALAFLLSPGAPMGFLVALQASVVVLAVASRLMQATTNFKNKSTGQLSLITILLQFVGSLARILTSIQETGDRMTIVMYSVSSLTNSLLLFQIFHYATATKPSGRPLNARATSRPSSGNVKAN